MLLSITGDMGGILVTESESVDRFTPLTSTTTLNRCTKKMTPNEYQTAALQTAIYPNQGNNLIYPVLGLCGESGEVAEKVKKLIRDGDGVLTDYDRSKIALELSDCLWYAAVLAWELDYTMEEVMQLNLDKLRSRLERGTLTGSGDDR